MSYDRHPSEKLNALFTKKPWQGADPMGAKYLFVGLDANYAPNIEHQVPEIWGYLNDGPNFWHTTGYHHPFRLPKYSGSGDLYHENFEKLGFLKNEAEQVSFIELLHVPTIGTSKLEVEDLCERHMLLLNNIFENGKYKWIFISSNVIGLMRKTHCCPVKNRIDSTG
jgi:hypothetical protein